LGVAQLRAVQTLDNLAPRIEAIARQLEVPPPTIADLRNHAQSSQQYDRLMRLDALATEDT
jgi:hypothetical protein